MVGASAADFRQTVVGTRSGADSYTLLESGLVAQIDTHASRGVADQLTLRPSANTIGFSTEAADEPVTLSLTGPAAGGAQHNAAVTTTSFHGAGDTMSFTGSHSTVTFVHHGRATTFKIELSSLQHNGSPSNFSSGPLRIGAGQTAHITGVRWSNLIGSTLRVRIGRRTLTVANRARALKLARIARLSAVAGRHGAITLSINARTRRLPRGAAVALVWLVRRGHHLIATHALPVTSTKPGFTRTWVFNPSRPGRYQLTARLMVIIPTAAGVSSSSRYRDGKLPGVGRTTCVDRGGVARGPRTLRRRGSRDDRLVEWSGGGDWVAAVRLGVGAFDCLGVGAGAEGDPDCLGPLLLGLGNMDLEHATVEVGLDPVGVDAVGQCQRSGELAERALEPW